MECLGIFLLFYLTFFSRFSRQKRVGGIAYTVHGSTNIKSDFYFQDFEACGQTSVDKKPNALWARDGKASDFKISFWAIHAFNLTGLANRTQVSSKDNHFNHLFEST